MSDDLLRRNAILARLPGDEFGKIESYLSIEHAAIKAPAYEPGKPITDVYFPLSSVWSVVAVIGDQIQMEVATTGREGMVGLPVFLGASTSPQAAFCQVPGEVARITVEDFRAVVANDGALHALLSRFTQATMVQVSQNVVCNRNHSAGARMARWLLATADRVDSNQFFLTQEFLSQMLGVQRSTVSETAQGLQAEGLIRYSRGDMTIVDRPRLERTACECYHVVRDEFDDFVNGPQQDS